MAPLRTKYVMGFSPLAQRHLLPELMDQPGLDDAAHRRALLGLGRLNAISGASRALWREIAARTGAGRGDRLRVLDIASGGGDIALGLWKLARRSGVTLSVEGLDLSPTACAQASRQTAVAGGAVRFRCVDVIHAELPAGFDVAMSSLFLHHLTWEQSIALLAKMRASATHVVISDLRRSPLGLAVAHVACRVATRSRVVRYDGPQSVRSAFTLAEMAQLFAEAQMAGACVRRAWPWRILAAYSRS